MKEEALKLADAMECRAKIRRNAKDRKSVQENSNDRIADQLEQASQMIRRLVEELDCSESYIKQYQLERKPTITKLDGKVVAVTMTDDEHRVHEVLWEAPKPLSDDEIDKLADEYLSDYFNMQETINFARAIEERHGIK